jgi:PAS domain S-box-containing protein
VDNASVSFGIYLNVQAEVDLIQYSQRLQLATASGKLAIWDWDVANNNMFWDERMFELYGISRETFPCNLDAWTNGLHPGDKRRAIDECNSALLGEREFNTTFRVIHPDGTIKYIRGNGLVIRDDSGKAVRMIGINRDITEQKQKEEERKNLEAHLQQAQKMEAIGTLAGGIAHDFNNILGAILGYSEMAKEDSLSGSVNPHDLEQIILAGTRAKALVHQILAFSRQTELQRIPLQPSVIIKESIRLLRSTIPTTIDIQQDLDPKTDLILADPTQIHQILMNLCTNAYHAMEETGGTLSISLKNITLTKQDLPTVPLVKPGNFVRLTIKDTGVGIEPEIRSKIFDPFFTTKETGKGTGLGLAIAHGIIDSYGGFITCRSKIGDGTVFEISLPALSEHIVLETKELELITGGTERILFIDDELMLAEMNQNMLSKLGYSVTVRTNSLEALTTFQNQPNAFDLVITDQTMPGMTGVVLARRMLQIRPEMPIILCTGYSTIVSEDEARSLGIKGFAMKPLSKKDIAAMIRKVLDGGNRLPKSLAMKRLGFANIPHVLTFLSIILINILYDCQSTTEGLCQDYVSILQCHFLTLRFLL